MRIIHLECKSEWASYEQTVREIIVEREDEANWYGKPIAIPACHTLQWPKFVWKEVKHNTGQENANTLA